MLPREHRLTTGPEFRDASRKGRRSGSRSVVVHLWLDGEGGDTPPRVGFVVSKAVGNAVTRNRVKRRLRHLVRERIDGLPGSAVLVVRALPAAAGATYDDLERDLGHCLERVTH